MLNYNDKGASYTIYSQNVANGISGYMPEPAVMLMLSLKNALISDASKQENHEWVNHYLGSLHHLESVLKSIETIVESLDYLKSNLLSPTPCAMFPKIIIKKEGHLEPYFSPPALISISSGMLEIEIETFLLKATSALERISQLIAFQCNLGKARSYKDVINRLRQREENERCVLILELIAEVNPTFVKTVISHPSSNDCIRNAIAHRSSFPEMMNRGFNISWLNDGSLLAFDAEIENIPLIASVRELALAIPYFMLYCIKILLGLAPEKSHANAWSQANIFNISFFEPTWINPFLNYSSLISSTHDGPLVSTLRWTPGGMQIQQHHLLSEVWEMRVNPQKIN